jgi:1,4-alpha-glucan branching enzyme
MTNTRKVKFRLAAPDANTVTVAGTFNEWDATRTSLRRGKDGQWTTKLPLAPGRYEYRFVVDGQWLSDPNAKESVPNPHGGDNSVVVV